MMVGDLFVKSLEPFLGIALGLAVGAVGGLLAWREKRRKDRLRHYRIELERQQDNRWTDGS